MSPERAFLALAGVFGLLFAILTPPYEAPDEKRHFARSFLVAEGRLAVPGQAPGYEVAIPKSLTRLQPGAGPGRPERIRGHRYDWAYLRSLLGQDLAPEERVRVGSLSYYSPLPYAPAALAVALARPTGASALVLLYAARLASLAVWIALSWWTVRVVPVRKWAFVLIALTPMAIFQGACVTADSPTNALAGLFVAFAARAAFGAKARVGRGDVLGMAGAAAALALAKPGYWPLALLPLAIPRARFGAAWERWGVPGLVLAAMLLPSILWTLAVRAADPPALAPGVDPQAQLAFVLSEPARFVARAAATGVTFARLWIETWVGVLGHLEVSLPGVVYVGWPLLVLAACVLDGRDPEPLGAARRLFLAGVFVACSLTMLLMAYLGWNQVAAERILGVQGRYFAPAVPVLLLVPPSRRQLPRPGGAWALAGAAALVLTVSVTAMLRVYYRS